MGSRIVRVGPAHAGRLRTVAGVRSVELLQHRFAYAGADLQDLYGVRPATIGAAAQLCVDFWRERTPRWVDDWLAPRPDSPAPTALDPGRLATPTIGT